MRRSAAELGSVVVEAAELIALGSHPALAFLNSAAAPAGVPMELIPDGAGYVDWLARAGLIDDADAAEINRFADLDAVAADAVALREWLRPLVATWATALEPRLPDTDVARLTGILATDHRYGTIRRDTTTGAVTVADRRAWHSADQLLVPPIAAVAGLLADGDRDLVRKCEAPRCTLWFYDRTKSHRRRWCSMAVCGNQEKARQHRRRRNVPSA